MEDQMSLEWVKMYEAGEPLEDLKRLTRKTHEYKVGVREASFSFLMMLKDIQNGSDNLDNVMKRVDYMFYQGSAPGYPKPFATTTYRGEA